MKINFNHKIMCKENWYHAVHDLFYRANVMTCAFDSDKMVMDCGSIGDANQNLALLNHYLFGGQLETERHYKLCV